MLPRDSIPSTNGSRHDKRLDQILQAGPISERQASETFKGTALSFCMSAVGTAVIAGILFFCTLLFLRPEYIFRKNSSDALASKEINYTMVIVLSSLGALCVFFVPKCMEFA